MSRARAARSAAAALALAGLVAGPLPARADAALTPPQSLGAMREQVTVLQKRLDFVVDQYSREIIPSDVSETERRFSEAEIQFLLQDYGAAAVFLYDVVDNPSFKRSSRYDDALYYLGESLYQQQSYLPARRYFAELLNQGGGRYTQDALLRLIQISDKLDDFTGVDGYMRRLSQTGAKLRPEVLYTYGKFLFRRTDLPEKLRRQRALQYFDAVPATSAIASAARYFIGVLWVEQDDMASALKAFDQVVALPVQTAHDRKINELAWMAIGRIHYHQGKYDAALDAYQHVDRKSDQFYESLYEIAWTYVKKGDYENAQRACEILLVGAADSPLAPQAKILMGHLYAKNKKFDEAVSTYNEVINTYAPVRDEIDALLALHDDPVRYFNELIARQGKAFDVQSILPPVAVKWASTESDVKKALAIVSGVEDGKQGVKDGEAIADRILASLDAGTLEPFPTLAEGHRRGVEIQNALLQVQTGLANLETSLVGDRASPALKARLEQARQHRAALQQRFEGLPTSKASLAKRTEAMEDEVESLAKRAYRLQIASDSLSAQLAAMGKYIHDTAATSNRSARATDALLQRLQRERSVIGDLHAGSLALQRKITELQDAVRSGTVGMGGVELRRQYEAALEAERKIAAEVRAQLGGADASTLTGIDQLRDRVGKMLARDQQVLDTIQTRAKRRRAAIRQEVMLDRQRLEGYGGRVDGVMGDTKNLVGRIALGSFKRVQKQFYHLILKADVGIIDVAWDRKTDKSKEIQKLAQEKDHQLRLLDQDFAEVLKEDK